jgi:hypothetical protein
MQFWYSSVRKAFVEIVELEHNVKSTFLSSAPRYPKEH